MSARSTAARRLNRDCDCTLTDVQALRQRVTLDDVTHAHLFSPAPVFLDPTDAARMASVVAAIEAVVQLPAYRREVLARTEGLAVLDKGTRGVFTGFDFHIAADGPKLIEINTNAGGALLNIEARRAQRSCCGGADDLVAALPAAETLETAIVDMFLAEWRAVRGDQPLRGMAIVDDDPPGQYLYPEFLLAQRLFSARGVAAQIVDPAELELREGRVWANGQCIDLVYNRHTDFQLAGPRLRVLREAYVRDLAVVTPHPRAHALYADKRNLALLGDAKFLRQSGVDEGHIAVLSEAIPTTREVMPGDERWWTDKRDWFFKPRDGFGSRGTYRGDKMTRRVFEEVLRGGYIAQQLVTPGERWRSTADGRQAFKVDVRCYTWRGEVQLMAARLYQGQTTNFRTPGGGFAPVYVIGASTPGPPRC